MLSFHLLGPVSLHKQGQPLGHFRSQKEAALLIYLAQTGQIDSAASAAALQTALDAYRGDFLADFHLSDAPRFDQWVTMRREHIRRQVIAAYHKLGQYALATGDFAGGIAAAQRWLDVDTLDDAAHTRLPLYDGHCNPKSPVDTHKGDELCKNWPFTRANVRRQAMHNMSRRNWVFATTACSACARTYEE